MTVHSIKEAWQKADEIFPTDYSKDDYLSERSGYSVYVSTAEGFQNCWISDLGDRLEVNINGTTTNIWIEEDEKTKYTADIEAVGRAYSPIEAIDTKVINAFVNGYRFGSDSEQRIYNAMRTADDSRRQTIAFDVITAYCEAHHIEWASQRILSVTNYENSSNGGHFVIEALVTLREYIK